MVGVLLWLLVVENLLVDIVPAVSRFMPGALGQAITGQRTGALHSPALGALLLAVYAAIAVAFGYRAITGRNFA